MAIVDGPGIYSTRRRVARKAVLADLDSAKVISKFVDLAEPVIGKEAAEVAVSVLSRRLSDWRAAVRLLGACGGSG